MRKRLLTALGLIMIVACVIACGSNNTEQAGNAAETPEITENATAIKTYEFETFDGLAVVINEGNIVSQEICEEPLEWEGLPADAEQIAPGRDYVLFEDAENYYVEDAADKLVTVAFKELGDVIEETDYAIFDNDVFTFNYDPKYFVVGEDEECVTVSFYNEEIQTAGSNTITFTEIKNADALEAAKGFAKQYGVNEDSVYALNLGTISAATYGISVAPTESEASGSKTKTMACAIANGDNVIAIEVLAHVEPDEGMDMFISDKISEVLDTLTIK